jgi:hypothetical protein
MPQRRSHRERTAVTVAATKAHRPSNVAIAAVTKTLADELGSDGTHLACAAFYQF